MDTMNRNAPPPPEPQTPQQVTSWLDYILADLVTRRDELLPALRAMLEAYPEIADEVAAGCFTENIRMAAVLEKSAKLLIAEQKQPHLEAGRTVDGWRTRFFAPLEEVVAPARAALLAYQNAKLARARAEAENRAREAVEAARKAAEEAASPFAGSAESELAAQASVAAHRATMAATVTPAARVTGRYGAVASVSMRWAWEITDAALIPFEYLVVNESAIDAVMKDRDPKSGRPRRTIPGIAWIQVASLGVR